MSAPTPMTRTKWTGNPARCSNPICGTAIGPGEVVLVDRMTTANFCEPCGKTLHYHRKKAGERGELLPLTHEDAEKRLEQR